MGQHRVLLVDDEEELTTALAERLEMRGMVVDTAPSGETALEIVIKKDFDAVVLDLAMPGWDGIETLKRLRQERPDLQVVLLTGRATVSKGVEAMKLGASDFIEKPAEFEDLLKKIDAASAKKALLTEERMEHDLDDIMRKKGW